ncbi:hypothetical protein Btru_055821 [Bulinus truncatus]|nr:hypothetical protein Btru_055821 [Bulinus truncatus]
MHSLKHCIYIISDKPVVKCINMPPFPVFGHLKVSGYFVLTIVCPEADKDLPLNSPGKGGVLYCQPEKPNYDLVELSLPDCLPIRLAKSVQLPFLFVFTADKCLFDFGKELVQFRDKYFSLTKDWCGSSSKCTWSDPTFTCGANKNFDNGKKAEIDVSFSLQTPYSAKENFTINANDLEKFRRDMIQNRGKEQAEYWHSNTSELMVIDVGLWTANCQDVPDSKGSILALHYVASCRGCPVSHFFNALLKKCQQCNFNFYTKAPYSSECIPCPPESDWGSERAQLLSMCYGRD